MTINTFQIKKALEKIQEANNLIQLAGIPQPAGIEDDPVYQIHNILENAKSDIEEILEDAGIELA